MIVYDTNNQMFPLFFSNSAGTECHEQWKTEFETVDFIEGFDVPCKKTIVDQGKNIDREFRASMRNALMFLDMLHVQKNMANTMGVEKTVGVCYYQSAVRTHFKSFVDDLKDK